MDAKFLQVVQEFLTREKYLSPEDFQKILDVAQKKQVDPLSLVAKIRDVTPLTLRNLMMAHNLGMPYYDLDKHPPKREVVEQLPEEFARAHGLLVIAQDAQGPIVACSSPKLLPKVLDAIRSNLLHGSKEGGADTLRLVYVPEDMIERAFHIYVRPLESNLDAVIKKVANNAPLVLEAILTEALNKRVSDVHLEPRDRDALLRYRIDGVLHEVLQLPKTMHDELVNRVKIESNLPIDEHYVPLDGAIRFRPKNLPAVDIRVSIVPLVDGQKVVMRLLGEQMRSLTLDQLGFSETNKKIMETATHTPFGMVISTGPTGSGKSTTLYGLIKLRNTPDVNISTIEDPVEYKLPGINHIQVNLTHDLTFARGLRSLLRQDPDIILVGEIRDGETANIGVSAAMTGHLVFSTLHSNDAATAIPRLIEMGVEPFLLASTLKVVLAQRLVRRLCSWCKYDRKLTQQDIATLYPSATAFVNEAGITSFPNARGCSSCSNTGYAGRIAIHELISVTQKLQELIVKRVDSSDILRQARLDGTKMMFEDGIEKVKQGITSLEEVLRVASPPDILVKQ